MTEKAGTAREKRSAPGCCSTPTLAFSELSEMFEKPNSKSSENSKEPIAVECTRTVVLA